jgi:DNA-binding MarR family transcriptional regulator
MYQEILQRIGLSLNEARVYEALLHLGEVNVNKISIKSKVHRRKVSKADSCYLIISLEVLRVLRIIYN